MVDQAVVYRRVKALVVAWAFSGATGFGGEPSAEVPRTPRDLATFRQRILERLLVPPRQGQAEQLLGSLRADGSWPDVDYDDRGRAGWKTHRHLANLLELTRAYSAPRCDLHGDAELRRAVLAALDFWLKHDFQNPNWWWNQIGVPRALSRILLLLDDELSDAQRQKGTEILQRAKLGMTGQNLVWVAEITVMRGLLAQDPGLVAGAFARIADEIRIIPNHEGIQADFSFHQHGPCLYSHGYGAAFALDCSRMASDAAGTRFAFPPEKIELLSHLILDGHQWMSRGPAVDYGAVGRQIARKNQHAGYLRDVAENMLRLPTGRQEEFRALARRAAGDLSTPLLGNRHFWRSGMMAHHRPGYSTSARTFSKRIVNTDMPCNSEGLKSHHIADGCNLLFCSGDEYRDIFPVWDWQKVPGTTVEQTPTLSGAVRRRGSRSFVGGVSDGTYGLAAFDFARDRLAARKAWFFFDTEYVCLGAGITCKSEHPVVTTLNQCRLAGEVTICDRPAGRGSSPRGLPRGEQVRDDPAWVHHGEVAYLFLQAASVFARHGPQRGSWWAINHVYSKEEIALDVFTLWIDHGKNPAGAGYAYVVAPGMPLKSVADYAARADVQVLRNDPEVQAVRHAGLKITGIAFYRPATLRIDGDWTVGVDEPCLLLLQHFPDKLSISVSNPENVQRTVGVRVDQPLQGENVETLPARTAWRVEFRLPDGPTAGRSVTQILSRAD